ncbi:MAG: D-alanine--D-alanine ligase [Ruminococcaceae bacterium]|nr:D-alanine--D-alanine ligase [Oscillospiraceae bacterium]
MKTVILLFGGKSSEYEVSLSSATAAYNNIDKEKFNVITVGISREGRFYLYNDDPAMIAADSWMNGVKYPLSVDLAEGCLTYERDGKVEKINADAVLPMIHGKFCEDGTLQGMFAVAGIPIVGCDCQSSAVCMDKAVTKAIIDNQTGIRQAKAVVVRQSDVKNPADADAIREKCEREIGYPMFVKPARAGSSVGVTKVKSAEKFAEALMAALDEDSKVLIEESILGPEIEVAVLEESGVYTVAHPAEIDKGSAEFYDYETKYISDASSFYLPARLSEEKMCEVMGYAETIFKALDCRAFSRVDFFYTPEGEFVFNEINTLPGFTPISMYPKMMMNEGIAYSEILERLISTAK